jgi:hypothetical protein
MRRPPTKRCMGSYGLVQAERTRISAAATKQGTICGFVISVSSVLADLPFGASRGPVVSSPRQERRMPNLHSDDWHIAMPLLCVILGNYACKDCRKYPITANWPVSKDMPSIGKLAGQGYDRACWAEPRTRRMSALTPSTSASDRASAPCRTSALAQHQPRRPGIGGFTPPREISYRGVKLHRVSAALRRSDLRRGADLPQVGRCSREW